MLFAFLMPFDNTGKELLYIPPANTLPIAEVQTEGFFIYYNNKRTIISSPEASSLNPLMCLIQDAVKKSQYLERSPVRSWGVQNLNSDNLDLIFVGVISGWLKQHKEKHFISGKFVNILLQSLHPNQARWDVEKGSENSTLKTSIVALWNKK